MKCFYCIASGTLSILVFAFSILLAQPEKIIINNTSYFQTKERSPVIFAHGIHMEGDLPCSNCHHIYQDGKNILDEDELEDGNSNIKCVKCHGKRSGNKYNLREAFHLQCMGCHDRMRREGKKTGPSLCAKCHPRK